MPYTITPLLTGVRNPDQGIMTYQQGYGHKIWLPIWSFLLRGQGHTVVVDTGLDEDEVMEPPGFSEDTGMAVTTLSEALEAAGTDPGDVDTVILTHLHDDHCGNNALFPKARFIVSETELEFCRAPHPLDHRYDEYFIENVEFETVDGEAEPLPGIRLIPSPGHTPGTLSVAVETRAGTAVITGFCCNARNFPEAGPAVCPGVHCDAYKAYDSIQAVKAMADDGAVVLPMHEMDLPGIVDRAGMGA